MASLIKDVYSPEFFSRLSYELEMRIPLFKKEKFVAELLQPSFFQKEYKERMKMVTAVLHQFLPADFSDAAVLISNIANNLKKGAFKSQGIAFMFLPDYLETYGINYLKESTTAFEEVTQFISCEFAVRPFIIKYPEEMMEQMQIWSRHEDSSVRRLATEGSRPRLPWAMAIPHLKKDPSPILPILENLKNDPSPVVRKSVANNLNDIAKDNPDVVIQIAKKWLGNNTAINAVVKHGCRTLLKKGDMHVLSLFSLSSQGFNLTNFIVTTPTVTIGEPLTFCFTLSNTGNVSSTVRLEYALYYRKQNGQLAKKVFKISEKQYLPLQTEQVCRNHKFVPITTRKYYVGEQKVSVIVNGKESPLLAFALTNKSAK